MPPQPAFKRSRPAPRNAAGKPKQIADTVTWTRIVDPHERYRIVYQDRTGDQSIREVELTKLGESEGSAYLGVFHEGKFKTMRADRVLQVLEQITTGHPSSIHSAPTYRTELPVFPLALAAYRVPTIAVGNRTWTVDLNRYTCTCPEKRVRTGKGYKPGQLGHVCPHIARAILDHLPADDTTFTPELRSFLANPRNIHIDNLR
jgi:hypothetical protein